MARKKISTVYGSFDDETLDTMYEAISVQLC